MVFTALFALLRLRRRYDVMLVCGYRVLGIPAMLVSLFSGKPCVLKADSQGELSGRFFAPGLARFGTSHDRFPVSALVSMRNRLLRPAACFIAISTVIEQELLDGGITANRIKSIPNSVDVTLFHPVDNATLDALRGKLGLPTNRRIAVFTGRLARTKGLPSLLRAWRQVIARHPNTLLVLVGSGGLGLQNCEDELRAYVKANRLTDSVFFAGSVTNVHEYLQAADLFVFPSEREAFGISIIEAMACGLPVITTVVDGIRDVIRPGVDALAVPPCDEDALAGAIMRVLEDGPEIKALKVAARRHAVESFSTDEVVDAYRVLLAGLVRS
jgi:glycosyltransferase involved in cell wall biosynthesis